MRKLKFVFVLSFISILAFAQTGNSFKNTAITINENAGKIDTTGTEFGVYSNFTFIPGNKLLFYDDFATGALGDFPVNWETGGSGEVVQPVGTTEKWLSLQRRSGYLPVMVRESQSAKCSLPFFQRRLILWEGLVVLQIFKFY